MEKLAGVRYGDTTVKEDLLKGRKVGMDYGRGFAGHMFMIPPAGGIVGAWLQSFREFPPRQNPGSFNLDPVMEDVTRPHGGGN